MRSRLNPLPLALLTFTALLAGCPHDGPNNAGSSPTTTDHDTSADATNSREIWAGEDGYGLFELRSGGELVGAFAVLSKGAKPDAVSRANDRLDPDLPEGKERWMWKGAQWPQATLKLKGNLTLEGASGALPASLSGGGTSQLTHVSFPSTALNASGPTPDGDDRVYAMSLGGVGAVGWLWVELSGGVATTLHWYKLGAVSGPFLKVTDANALTLTPASAGDVPSGSYFIIHQPVQGN